jgi:hypothetical protein
VSQAKPYKLKGISPEELANEIIASARKAIDDPTPEVQALIDEHGKSKVLAVFLGASIGAFNPQTPGIDFVENGKVIHRVEGAKR